MVLLRFERVKVAKFRLNSKKWQEKCSIKRMLKGILKGICENKKEGVSKNR